MAATTNFEQWNPTATNQKSDTLYGIDGQRSGGAVTGQFPSDTANKLFYQSSTMVAALALMLANKGYNTTDGAADGSVVPAPSAAVINLATQLANIVTNADLGWLQTGAAFNAASTGYLALPVWLGGVILKWGTIDLAYTSTVTYSVANGGAFPTAQFGVLISDISSTDLSNNDRISAVPSGRTGFTSYHTQTPLCFWVALGN